MSYFEAIILGIIQGLTEFIPVSSSGHLVLTHTFLGREALDLSVDAVLQLATVLAVLVYFRKEILRLIISFLKLIFGKAVLPEDRNILFAIILGTIPALVVGIFLEDTMETFFRSSVLVATTLIAGSALMFGAERYFKRREGVSSPITAKKGFLIGLFQALALVPGVSRSGATISGGLFNGLSREEATRFSFLLSFPIILISGLKKLFDLTISGDALSLGLPLLLSFSLSFIFGLWSIGFLLKYLRNHSLNVFAIYRIALAILIFFLI